MMAGLIEFFRREATGQLPGNADLRSPGGRHHQLLGAGDPHFNSTVCQFFHLPLIGQRAGQTPATENDF